MSRASFDENRLIRKRMGYFLALQITALFVVFILISIKLPSVAFALSCFTFVIFIGTLGWLYWLYINHPLVKEKQTLTQQADALQIDTRYLASIIQATQKKRDELAQGEQDEILKTLVALQNDYIENGLKSYDIRDAMIAGIGNALTRRLVENGITNAFQINDRISTISGFGETKQKALFAWRHALIELLKKSQPVELPIEQSQNIKDKYHTLHDQNNTAERNAQNQKQNLDDELSLLLPRLESLSSITFTSFLNKSLASQNLLSVFVAFILICSQATSGFSATTAALVASIPTSTPTATFTFTPTNTFTPTITLTPTITNTATITYTPTITNTPTITFTPTKTFTPTPTRTSTPTKTRTPLPTSTYSSSGGGGGGGGNANCSPAYPTVCIPPPPPDLDCPDIPYRNFRVLPPDPHRFDRDGDGIGCEN